MLMQINTTQGPAFLCRNTVEVFKVPLTIISGMNVSPKLEEVLNNFFPAKTCSKINVQISMLFENGGKFFLHQLWFNNSHEKSKEINSVPTHKEAISFRDVYCELILTPESLVG